MVKGCADAQRHETRRFHVFYALRFFRYGILLGLVPILHAVTALQWQAVVQAVYSDALILLVFGLFSVALWRTTGICFTENEMTAHWGILWKRTHYVRVADVCALEVRQSLRYRLFGAARVTLYFENMQAPNQLVLYLSIHDARNMAQTLMPVYRESSVYAPSGIEKLNFVVLSANVITSCVFISMTLSQLDDLFAQDFKQLAAQNLSRLSAVLSHWLPASISGLAALFFLIITVTVLYSFVHAFGFSVCRNGGILLMRGGLITRIERRIRAAQVTCCEMRVTLVARMLRHAPVYVRAGSLNGRDIPLMVCPLQTPQTIGMLLEGFSQASMPLCSPRQKSPVQYLWKSGVCAALFLAMLAVSVVSVPSLLAVPATGVFFSLAALLLAIEGIFREGICQNENRTLSLCYTRFLTRHEVCILTHSFALSTWQTPFAFRDGRCDVAVRLAGGARFYVRGLQASDADSLRFPI